jgi:hypothetical protein
MTLMAIVGGDAAYGMKRKTQPEALEQQEKDKKQKISTSEAQKEKEAQCFINKQILPKFCVKFYATLKKDAILNDTYIKENGISLNECNPYILQNRGVPLTYFPYVRRVFQLVEILKELITTKKINNDFITKTGLSMANLGPDNIPPIPLEYCPIIKKAYDQKCEQIKKSRTVGAVAEELGMDCAPFIEILKELLKKSEKLPDDIMEPNISMNRTLPYVQNELN